MCDEQIIIFYGGEDAIMNATIYEDLESCKDYNEIDSLLQSHGYLTDQEKYAYLIERMGVISAQFTGIPDDDVATMYALAKENYLLDHWRASNEF